MRTIFVLECCYVNIVDLCRLDTNTIANKETKANTKVIDLFGKNTNTNIQDHLKIITKTITKINRVYYIMPISTMTIKIVLYCACECITDNIIVYITK